MTEIIHMNWKIYKIPNHKVKKLLGSICWLYNELSTNYLIICLYKSTAHHFKGISDIQITITW